MDIDMIIKNGQVIDPAQNVNAIKDIGIYNGFIIDLQGEDVSAKRTIDASGCYVFPGLIDFHTHIFHQTTHLSCNPDFLPATGVTTAVDAGSSGCQHFEEFYDNIISRGSVRIKAYLNCCSTGMHGKSRENFDPALFEKKKIAYLKEKYPNEIMGLKMRLSYGLAKDIEPLAAAVKMADEIGNMPICVHVTNPPCKMEDIANVLRKGDVMCHVYHGTGNTILGEDGQIINEIHKARERGVLFDVANGKMNCSHFVSNEALKQKFLPDIISTDMTGDKLYYASHARSLPFVMSKYISFGMSLYDVVRCTTETPAKVMGMEGQIGTLAPGAFADVSIMKMVDKQATYHDTFGAAYVGNQLLIPQMTISNGEIAFGQIDFNLSEIP